tara:strand:+ start:256 stop:420 length:165 start_codon:yes stop_codon:yes gene_type:complete
MSDAYIGNGYKDREDYLESLCEDYPAELVYGFSDLLGEDEDFDGLISSLEDYQE